jgi:hypothetical protein
LTIRNAICKNGFIDKWAEKVSYNASTVFHKSNNVDLSVLENEDCCNPHVAFCHFEYNSTPNHKKSFWFISITNSFSDSFWDQLTTGINELRFCTGLGGKHNAYVRCSSLETDAVFSTGGRFLYHSLPLSPIEEKILTIARFVMSFQKAYIEKLCGSDFTVTWDANLLHHVVGPIMAAVYSAHNDFSPLEATRARRCIFARER